MISILEIKVIPGSHLRKGKEKVVVKYLAFKYNLAYNSRYVFDFFYFIIIFFFEETFWERIVKSRNNKIMKKKNMLLCNNNSP